MTSITSITYIPSTIQPFSYSFRPIKEEPDSYYLYQEIKHWNHKKRRYKKQRCFTLTFNPSPIPKSYLNITSLAQEFKQSHTIIESTDELLTYISPTPRKPHRRKLKQAPIKLYINPPSLESLNSFN